MSSLQCDSSFSYARLSSQKTLQNPPLTATGGRDKECSNAETYPKKGKASIFLAVKLKAFKLTPGQEESASP